jgi:hypothetical protein
MAGLVPAIGFSAASNVSGDCVRDAARPLAGKEGFPSAEGRLPKWLHFEESDVILAL